MSFLLGCVLLYTPLGEHHGYVLHAYKQDCSSAGNLSFLDYSYVYGLALGCSTIVFMLPFVLFAKVVGIDELLC